jgi:hypothetical protein
MGDSTTARDADERCLRALLPMLSHDELRVVTVQVRRMIEIGRDKYGPLDLDKEKRDWDAEAAAESSDRLFYDACRVVARDVRRREAVARFKSADLGLNKTGADCTDCAAPVDELHADGCQWVEVVR